MGSWRCSAILLPRENDAERAVRAALSIQRALAEVNRKNAGSRQASARTRASASKPAR